jgi:hypothetical protein
MWVPRPANRKDLEAVRAPITQSRNAVLEVAEPETSEQKSRTAVYAGSSRSAALTRGQV